PNVMDEATRLGLQFNGEADINRFLSVYNNFQNNCRMQRNRGHTPREIMEMVPPEERIPKSLSFGPNIRKALADRTMNVEELRQGILTMDNIPSEELRFDMLRQIAEITGSALPQQAHKQKIGRNDPCPCGSGKKYKKCCGR
ncbi:SEC-C metal-binding domain-containing protein, partial [Paramuribaculum intestinale]|uniref:SEC-C metal-binding domain-containing protein n=2 Tax=Bacteria TaxID=2 RepID=UPI0025AFCCAA